MVQASSIEEDGEGGEDSDSGDIKGGTPLEDENEIETEWGNEAIDDNANSEEEDGLVQGSVCPAIAFEGHSIIDENGCQAPCHSLPADLQDCESHTIRPNIVLMALFVDLPAYSY